MRMIITLFTSAINNLSGEASKETSQRESEKKFMELITKNQTNSVLKKEAEKKQLKKLKMNLKMTDQDTTWLLETASILHLKLLLAMPSPNK